MTTPARLHITYSYLLNECLFLREQDALYLKRELDLDPDESYALGIRSTPSEFSEPVISYACDEAFGDTLRGVPGFYVRMFEDGSCRWALNLNIMQGRLIRPHHGQGGRIQALKVLRKAFDPFPKLLTSAGLLWGSSPLIERTAA